MKTRLAIVLLAISATAASAQLYNSDNNRGSSFNSGLYGGTGSNPSSHYVAPSMNSRGTSTAPHYQTNPNNTQMDNYSTRGNVNPYTGAVGTRSPRY